MSAIDKAIKALQDYWDAVEEMNEEEFNVIGYLTINWGTSNFAIDHIKQDLMAYQNGEKNFEGWAGYSNERR